MDYIKYKDKCKCGSALFFESHSGPNLCLTLNPDQVLDFKGFCNKCDREYYYKVYDTVFQKKRRITKEEV